MLNGDVKLTLLILLLLMQLINKMHRMLLVLLLLLITFYGKNLETKQILILKDGIMNNNVKIGLMHLKHMLSLKIEQKIILSIILVIISMLKIMIKKK